jgi:phytoene dehydrogenase-like protein
MENSFDVIVIGAGINGLACGAYLARCGLEVAVVERRNECGPFALTEDIFGAGVPVDTHAGVCFVTMSPVLGDLELDRFGLDLIFPRVPTGTVWKDGKNLIFYPDLDRTCQELARYSDHDARTFRRLREAILARAVEILERGAFSAPSEEGLEYLWSLGGLAGFSPDDFRTMNGFEYLDLLFENETVKCALLGQAAIGIFGDPSEKGEGAVMTLMGQVCSFGVPRGGMHTLVHALVRCFRHHGGTLLLNAPVERIEFEGDRPALVHLAESSPIPEKTLRARHAAVVHVSPPVALELFGDEPLRDRDRALWRKMKDWDMTGHCAFTSYVLMRGPTRWKSRRWNPDIQECAFPLRAWDSWDHAKRSFQHAKNEELFGVAGDVGEMYQLGPVDPSRVPPDGRTALVYEVDLAADAGGPGSRRLAPAGLGAAARHRGARRRGADRNAGAGDPGRAVAGGRRARCGGGRAAGRRGPEHAQPRADLSGADPRGGGRAGPAPHARRLGVGADQPLPLQRGDRR